VSDVPAMTAAIDAAERRWGRLNGVVHGALVLNDGAIRTKTLEAARVVFRPKIDGTRALQTALAGRPLDLFVIFSSLVSTISGPGQVDYCAASAFQDAFAHAEQGHLAARVVSIDWAAWREVGKAYRSAVERGAPPALALPDGMSPAEGFDALGRALASGAPQVIVSPATLASVRRSRLEHAPPVEAEPVRQPVAGEAEADGTDAERLIAGLWRDVLGVTDVRATDNFFDLGGDSVMSLQFIAQARKAGLRLTNKQVFEHQTVAAIAAVAVRIEPREGGVPA
jgi:aryl carrier-like protein